MLNLQTYIDQLSFLKTISTFREANKTGQSFAVHLFRYVRHDKKLSNFLYPVTSVSCWRSWTEYKDWCANAEDLLKQAISQQNKN